MSIINVRVNDKENKLIKEYAMAKKITVSELVRQSVLNTIEDEIDLDIYNKEIKKHKKDPKDISFDEMMDELGLYE